MNLNTVFNFLLISKCRNYILSETKIFSIEKNKSEDISNLDISFWLDFFKKNSLFLYENNKLSLADINKLINETVFKLGLILDNNNLIFEFFKKSSGALLTENSSLDENKTNIEYSWNILKENVNRIISDLIIEEDNLITKGWNWAKEKVKNAASWVKSKGVSIFFEQLRTSLQSWGGAAVTGFLAAAGPVTLGLGPALVFIVWGAMLCYDLYLGFAENNWNWINVCVSLLGTLTAGPGAKILSGIIKGLNITANSIGSGINGLINLIKKLMTSKSGSVVGGLLRKIVNGVGTIIGYMVKAASWLAEKLGIKFILQKIGQLKTWIYKIIDTLKANLTSSTVGTTGKNIVNPVKKVLKPTSNTGKNIANPIKQGVLAGGVTYGALKGFDVEGDRLKMFGGVGKDYKTDAQLAQEKESQAGSQLASNIDFSNSEISSEEYPP